VEQLIIVVDPDGLVAIEVRGVKGKSCKDVTRQIERALGEVISDRETPEIRDTQQEVKHVLNRG